MRENLVEVAVTSRTEAQAKPSVGHAPPTGFARAAIVAVMLVAVFTRFWGLSTPAETIWDEQYYALDAYAYLGGTTDLASGDLPDLRIPNERTWVHPPLGKELLTLGIGPLGFTPIGNRIVPAVLGVLAVGLVILIGQRLWRSWLWGSAAGALLAVDGLHIVHSRVAMLDGIGTTLALLGCLLALTAWQEPRARWQLCAAGTMFGAAVATKWSFGVLLPVWAFVAIRRSSDGADRSLRRLLAGLAAAFVAPAAMYLLAYGPLFSSHGFRPRDFVGLQVKMLAHQASDLAAHPDRSAPWTWPLLLHPIRYFPSSMAPSGGTEVLALGNPALWWGAIVAAAFVVVRRTRRLLQSTVLLPLAGYLLFYLPWFAIGRTKYSYYMLATTPFLALAATSFLRGIGNRAVTGLFLGSAIVVGAAFLPLWIGLPLPPWVDQLRWLDSWI